MLVPDDRAAGRAYIDSPPTIVVDVARVRYLRAPQALGDILGHAVDRRAGGIARRDRKGPRRTDRRRHLGGGKRGVRRVGTWAQRRKRLDHRPEFLVKIKVNSRNGDRQRDGQ